MVKIGPWSVGFKFGDLSKCRKYVPYRTKELKKALKKKKIIKDENKLFINKIKEKKIERLRALKTGHARNKFTNIINENYLLKPISWNYKFIIL